MSLRSGGPGSVAAGGASVVVVVAADSCSAMLQATSPTHTLSANAKLIAAVPTSRPELATTMPRLRRPVRSRTGASVVLRSSLPSAPSRIGVSM